MRHGARWRFSGELQSWLSMAEGQRLPLYNLLVKRWVFARRYILECEPGEGDWITQGLNAWSDPREPASPSKCTT